MTLYYSKSTGGFYDTAIADYTLPTDAVEIAADTHASLLAAQAAGKTIAADATGAPQAVDPATLFTLAQAQTLQLAALEAAYDSASSTAIGYTTKGGVTATFQADTVSQSLVQTSLAGYSAAAAVPTGFYWVAADNTQVAFTYADLQGLAATMIAQGWTAFQKLQTLKASVRAATTVAAVQAVVWA